MINKLNISTMENSKNKQNWKDIINRQTIIDSVKKDTKDAIYKTTDLWLNSFKLTHKEIFDKIWWLNIKKHYVLAQEIIKNQSLSIDDIKALIKDKNIDSNIRMEIVLAMYQNNIKVDIETFISLQSNLLNINKWNDWVYQANSETYIYTLFMFRNWTIFKWYIDKIEKDKEKEWDFIYHIWWYKKIKSSWKII